MEHLDVPTETTGGRPLSSKRRLVGAVLFALVVGVCVFKAFDHTIPLILEIVDRIEIEAARDRLRNSFVLNILIIAINAVLCGFVGGFLARRNFIAIALLANAAAVGAALWVFCLTVSRAPLSFSHVVLGQLYALLQLLIVIVSAIGGGFLARQLYAREYDLDLGSPRVTVFGIRWFHYAWILPLIVFPYLATVVMTASASASFFVELQRFSIAWYFIPLYPLVFVLPVMISWYVLGKGLCRFAAVMQFRQEETTGLKKLWAILLYGIVVPIFTFYIARLSVFITHRLPKP